MNTEEGIITEFFNPRLISQVPLHLQKKEPVIIIGAPGTGKTTLLKYIAHNYSRDFKAVHEFSGMQLRRGKEMDLLYLRASESKGGLVVIDGLDEILDKDALGEVLYIFENRKKFEATILASSRPIQQLKKFQKYARIYDIGFPVEVGKTSFYLLLDERFPEIPDKLKKEYTKIFESTVQSPYMIRIFLGLIAKRIAPTEILRKLRESINYQDPIITLANPKIILPEQQQLITDARVLKQSLVDLMVRDDGEFHKLSSRQFEMMVAELYDREGYEVELTPPTRDGGKDIILSKKSSIGNHLYYVECKKFTPPNKVSVGVIERLQAVVQIDRATAGIVVTSSTFSNPAIVRSKEIEHQMSLMDYTQLDQFIKRVTKKKPTT